MNTIEAQQFIFSDDGTCNYCNGIINNQGYFEHDEGCEGAAADQFNTEDEELDEKLRDQRFHIRDREEEEINDSEVERQVEEFRKRLEGFMT